MKTWSTPGSHRFRYIRRSLPSLLASDLPAGSRIVIVDDQSDDPRLHALLARLVSADPRIEVWRNPRRMGPNLGHEYNVPKLIDRFRGAEFLVFCDDDIVYHPGWLQRTLRVAGEAESAGLRGVLTALNLPARRHYASTKLSSSDVLLKERQAALNWIVPVPVYRQVGPFKDAGIAYDSDDCNRMSALKVPLICMRPSWVQNIGYFGAYQSGTVFVAPDFVGRLGLRLTAERAWVTGTAIVREYAAPLKQWLRNKAGLRKQP